MHNNKLKSLVLPLNIIITNGLQQSILNTNTLYFLAFPGKSQYYVVYNFSTDGVSAVKILPTFTFFYTGSYFLFQIQTKHFNKQLVSLYWHNFNKLFKSVTFASFGYCKILQFIGFRFRQRWFKYNQMLRLRLGYNKKVWVKCPADFAMVIKKLNPKKRTQFYFSFNKRALKQVITFLNTTRPASFYRGRGINLKEQPIELKEGKKTLW